MNTKSIETHFQNLKKWVFKWLLGVYSPEEFDSFNGRWLWRPLRKGVSFFVIGTLVLYSLLCVWEGFVWSTEASSGYGLLIIRLFVVIMFSILNLIALPFTAGHFLLFVIINATIIFPIIGIFHGLTLNQRGVERLREERKAGDILLFVVLFIIGLGVLFYNYGADVISGRFTELIHLYVFSSTNITIFYLCGLVFWILRNLYYSYSENDI